MNSNFFYYSSGFVLLNGVNKFYTTCDVYFVYCSKEVSVPGSVGLLVQEINAHGICTVH